MFRPNNFAATNGNLSFTSLEQDERDREQSSYSDENDTSNLSRVYHYETSEDDEHVDEQPNCCPELNRALIVYKAFYFLFFGAIGALFPYLAVFYKQLWLSPHQVGILIGLRPFIQMCASPLWGVLADTYNVSKWILLMSIGAWLASNYSISMVRPKQYESGCSLNLTYLPMTDDVDDQDFSWARIEPIFSKKNNITKLGKKNIGGNIERYYPTNNAHNSGKPGLDNMDYVENENLNDNFEDEKMINNVDDDRYGSLYDKNNFEGKGKTGEKSVFSTLFANREVGENAKHKIVPTEKTVQRQMIIEKERSNTTQDQENGMNRQVTENGRMEILRKMFRKDAKLSKRFRKFGHNFTASTDNGTYNANSFLIKQKVNNSTKTTNQKAILRIKSRSESSIRTHNAAFQVKSRNSQDVVYVKRANDDFLKNDDLHARDVLRTNDGLRETDGVLETANDFTNKESDEYLQNFMSNNEGNEYYAESILPNQRVLATESLKEEFDSLNAAGGVFWPIFNKPDATNSSEVESNGQSAETKKIFNILLVITICGTILSSPAATLSDTATLQALGDDKYRYGQQRLWGAFGWGIGAFIVGTIVSVTQEMKLCSDAKHIDYMLSFYVYAVVMIMAFICALFFKFEVVGENSYRESFWEAFKLFADCQHMCFILTLLCSGTAMGFTHTFLFWHLHDMGGSQFLFSIIAAVQCISEVFMYFVSGYLILKIGCDSVLYIGLLANVMRLFAYSVITQPYYSVLLEVLQGISSASIWTAAVCYVGLNEGVQVTLQAMLHGIYWGLGHGGGGMLGGLVVSNLGSNATFIIFGIACIVNLLILLLMKYWKKLFEFLSGYTSVETIPSGTYILVEGQRTGK